MEDPGPSTAYYAHFASDSDGPLRPPSRPSSPLLEAHDTSTQILDAMQSESLYTILNLPQSASDAEIRDRYRSLATTFHPDRQRDEVSRRAAHGRFTEIQRAYEVLTDNTKRTVYDLFGEEGLRTSWEVGPKVKSPEELRRHFQRQAYTKRQLDAEALVKPKGDINLFVDARAVFLSKSAFRNPELISHSPMARLSRIRPGRITMKHSFETEVGEKTQVVWAGQMVARSGQGGGNILGTVRHQFSPRLWVEVGSGLLQPRVLNGKGTYTHDENTFVTVNAVQQTLVAPPRFSVSLGRRIYAHTTGFLTYKSGHYSLLGWGTNLPPQIAASNKSAMSIGATTTSQTGTGWTLETQAGVSNSYITADWSTRLLGVKCKIGGSASTEGGISGFVDGEGKATGNVRAGVTVQLELAAGVTMRLRMSRLGQRISIPILLSHDPNPYVVFMSTVIPIASYILFHQFYILPRKKRRIAERVKQLREQYSEYIMQKKVEAQEALILLERPTSQKLKVEQDKQGLVIISAHYGLHALFTDRGLRQSDSSEEEIIDVTLPIQALVIDSKLYIPGGRGKFNLLGFWDPCIGEKKVLRVRYLFRGRLHQVTVDDSGTLKAPLKGHASDD